MTVVTEALFVEPTIDYNSEAFKTFVKDRVGDVSMWPSNVEDSYLDAIIATAIEEYEK